jgi:hypothetical protein
MVLCEVEDCKVRALFNFKGVKPPKFCSKHKEKNMFNVVGKLCIVCKEKYPSFGYEYKNNTHCGDCKKDDMKDVINKKCIVCKENSPSFGYENGLRTHCSKCKKDDMSDILHSKCQCGFIASFGYKDQKATHCSKCKKDDMISFTTFKCFCGITASYGYIKGKPICCASCRKDDMIDVKHNLCECNKNPSFGYEKDGKMICCVNCKTEEMISLLNRCNSNKQDIYCAQWGNPNYNGYCTHCYSNLFPDDPLTLRTRQKSKENLVRDYINSKFDGFIHDTPLWIGGCDCTHKRRIDHRRLIGNTLLCVETDENQHKYYNGDDEDNRYDDLMMIHGGKFIFIRFNPDKYKVRGEVRDPDMDTRLDKLERVIKKQIERIKNEENEDIIEIYSMYYDRE